MREKHSVQYIYILTESYDFWKRLQNGEFDSWKNEIEKKIEKLLFLRNLEELSKIEVDLENSLFLCDCMEEIQKLQNKGYYVAGWEEEEAEFKFNGLQMVVQNIQEIDCDYFEKIHQRLSERPWHIIDTERLEIWEMSEDDLQSLYTIYNDKDVVKYTENLYEDEEKELQYIKDYRKYIYGFYGYGTWVLINKQNGELIGRAGLTHRAEYDEAELGFVIGKKYWRQGYAYEACAKILELAKSVYEMEKVQALVNKGNMASIRLLEKLQFYYMEDISLDGEYFQRYLLDIKATD